MDDDNPENKSSWTAGLKRLSAAQLKQLSDAVHTETQRRLDEAKAKRPVSALSDDEFREWSADLMDRAG